MARRYRRRRRTSPVNDVVRSASRATPRGAFLLGLFGFVLFYWVIPGLLNSYLESQPDGHVKTAFESLYARRTHWLEWVGIVCGLVGVYFTIRNDYVGQGAGRAEKGIVGFLARLLGRNLE